jgi:selenide,water dikinase
MAEASGVSLRIRSGAIPLLPGAYQIFEKGSIPGAAFRNQEFTGERIHFTRGVDYNLKMLVHDAQTSGGLLMSVNPDHVDQVIEDLKEGDPETGAAVIGEVLEESPRALYFE